MECVALGTSLRDWPLYIGKSLIRNRPLVGPYSRTMSRVLRWPHGEGVFRMREVPLYSSRIEIELLVEAKTNEVLRV